ncbi:unnamed protein product, partial [marine sediment metagenome]
MENGMIIQFHTPTGIVEVDTETVTDSDLAALGLSRADLDAEYGDITRAQELLGTSPSVITQPEI